MCVNLGTQPPVLVALRNSTSDQDSSSRTWPSPCSRGRRVTAAADDVRTTRFTVPALTHDLITLRVPLTASSITSFCHQLINSKTVHGYIVSPLKTKFGLAIFVYLRVLCVEIHRSRDEEGIVAAGHSVVEAALVLQVGAEDL